MDWSFLFEAKKPRSAYKQQLRTKHLGQVDDTERTTRFRPGTPWRRKVSQMFYDLKIKELEGENGAEYRRRIMRMLNNLARRKGEEYVQKIDDKTLRALIKTFAQRYEREQLVKRERIRRSGVSGVYQMPATIGSKEPASSQLRRNVADYDVTSLSKQDLQQMDHPDVQRLWRAVTPNKEKHLRDKAVVWDTAGRPYYILIKPYKGKPGEMPTGPDGKRWFEAVIPKVLDYRQGQRKITDSDMEKYNKDSRWRNLMKSDNMTVLYRFQTNNFDAMVDKMQHVAWKYAKPWFGLHQRYRELEVQFERLDKKAMQGYGHGLSDKEEDQYRRLEIAMETLHDLLQGRRPKKVLTAGMDVRKAEELLGAWKSTSAIMPRCFTWYLWLLASEDEYGIRVPERRQMYPEYPKEKSAVKGKEPYWAIRPARKEGSPRWDQRIIRGLGYGMNDWERFTHELARSKYKFSNQSDRALNRLWVPLVGDLRKRFGLKLHPENITDYLDLSRSLNKAQRQTGPLVGREGGRLAVHSGLKFPQYRFEAGAPTREFALVPAMGYLQHFDSPAHGGERLIHGRLDFAPPTTKLDIQRPTRWSRVTRVRSRAYQQKKQELTGREPRYLGYDPKREEARRAQAEAMYAERLIQQNRQRLKQREKWIQAGLVKKGQLVAPTVGKREYKRLAKAGLAPKAMHPFRPVPRIVRINKEIGPEAEARLQMYAGRKGYRVSDERNKPKPPRRGKYRFLGYGRE